MKLDLAEPYVVQALIDSNRDLIVMYFSEISLGERCLFNDIIDFAQNLNFTQLWWNYIGCANVFTNVLDVDQNLNLHEISFVFIKFIDVDQNLDVDQSPLAEPYVLKDVIRANLDLICRQL